MSFRCELLTNLSPDLAQLVADIAAHEPCATEHRRYDAVETAPAARTALVSS